MDEPVRTMAKEYSAELVPLPGVGPAPEPLEDPRRSDVDEWGRSERTRAVFRTLYEPVYSKWFRVEWDGFDKIPAEGGGLLVANHAGAIPSDAPLIMHGIESRLGRPVYGLADYFFRSVPFVGTLWSRSGGVAARPENAARLLGDQGQLALVFPEGEKGPSKSFADRYRLRRFGRGGFIEIAMRSGVPVIPLAVIGSEEAMPVLFRMPAVAKILGTPYFPVTANLLAMGPLGLVVPFPAKIKISVLDPITFNVEPGLERYPRSLVLEESERVRGLIQEQVFEMLKVRRSVWFG
ncbi:MAG: lysophospholipid acyltransferase family protein [Actinomycetes bacterium]